MPVPCFPPKTCFETKTTVAKLELETVVTPGPPFSTYVPIGSYGAFTQHAFKRAFRSSFENTFGPFPQTSNNCDDARCACETEDDPIGDPRSIPYTFVSKFGIYELRGKLEFVVETYRGICILDELEIQGKKVSQLDSDMDWDKVNEEAFAVRDTFVSQYLDKLT